MKILLTHSYFLNLDPKQLQAGMPYAPLATLYAAAYLRDHNYEVRVHDVQFDKNTTAVCNTLHTHTPDVFVIYDDSFNYLSKMCLTNMRDAAFEMIKQAKENKCRVIVSSSDATDHYEAYLNAGADAVIIGEAEQTLLETIDLFAGKTISSLNAIQGLVYKTENGFEKTEARKVLKDLDHLPLPAWDLIDLQTYKETWMNKHGYFSINFVTTRGCPYKCNWCAKPVYGNRYNSHSPERIVELISQLQQTTGFDHIWFADDIFGLKPQWLRRFAELIAERKIRIRYKIQSRADLLLEEDNIKHLASSGCELVWIGAESGSQKILDAMDKGTKISQIHEATRLLKKNKVRVAFFLQLGYPGEAAHEIALTLNMVKELLPDDLGISVSYPLPGTKFYENVKAELKNKSNWTDSDDLDMMFSGTYKAAFYKHLQRYIHYRYRTWKGIQAGKDFFGDPAFAKLKQVFSVPINILKARNERNELKSIEPDAAKSF